MGPCSSILSTIYSYVSVPVSCLLKAIVSLTVCHFLFSNMLEFNGIRIHFSEDLCLHPGAKEDTRFSPQDGWFTPYLMDPTCAKERSHPSVFFAWKCQLKVVARCLNETIIGPQRKWWEAKERRNGLVRPLRGHVLTQSADMLVKLDKELLIVSSK